MEEKEEKEGWYTRGILIKYNSEHPLASEEAECKLDHFENTCHPK